MAENQSNKLDVNSASAEELASLPGVGPAIATRILSARPFDSLDDLQQVRGLSPQKVDTLRTKVNLSKLDKDADTSDPIEMTSSQDAASLLDEEVVDQVELPTPDLSTQPESFETASEEEVVTEVSEEHAPEERESTEDRAIVPVEEVREEAGVSDRIYVTRGQVFLMTLFGSVLAFVLAIALVLGILNGINGGLRFVTPEQLSLINREVVGLQSSANQLQDDLDGLRARLDNLDTLSSRVEGVEEATAELHTDLDSAASQLSEMQGGLDGIANQVDELRVRSDSFQGFLQGLQDLLTTTLEDEVR